jgi:hypothetical protein
MFVYDHDGLFFLSLEWYMNIFDGSFVNAFYTDKARNAHLLPFFACPDTFLVFFLNCFLGYLTISLSVERRSLTPLPGHLYLSEACNLNPVYTTYLIRRGVLYIYISHKAVLSHCDVQHSV